VIVKTRFWLPAGFLVAGFRGGLEKMLSSTGTEGSNPPPSSGESSANLTWGRIQPPCIWGARDAIPHSLHARGPDPQALGSVDNDDGLCPLGNRCQPPKLGRKQSKPAKSQIRSDGGQDF